MRNGFSLPSLYGSGSFEKVGDFGVPINSLVPSLLHILFGQSVQTLVAPAFETRCHNTVPHF